MTGITLVRHMRARPSIVFDLLSTVEGLTFWWGPNDFPVLSADADVRIGGAYRVRFRSIDGCEHECAGEFLEVVPPERLIMSWRWVVGGEPGEQGRASRVELHVRPDSAGTELTLIHTELANAESGLNHERGWKGALDKLCRQLNRPRGKSKGNEGDA